VLKRYYKLFLVSTSLAPVLFTLAFVYAHAGQLWYALISLIIAEFLLRATETLMARARSKLELLPIKLRKVKTSDREVIGFLLAYVTPIALAGGGSISIDPSAVLYLLGLFSLVVWGTHAYDFNPLLGLVGYHFFEVETDQGITYILITRREIVSVQQVTEVVQLTEYVLLDKQ
jgi:hypothetical protein